MDQRKNYYGHHRLNTPQNRLKRAVSYRHSGKNKISKKKESKSLSTIGESVVKSVSKYFSVWKDKVSEQKDPDAASVESTFDDSNIEAHSQQNIPEAPAEAESIPLSRKEARRKARDQWAEAMVTQPNASFFGTLFHPLHCLERASISRYISISWIKGFLWTVFAWFCFGLCTARLYVWKVYQMEFSSARYNFSDNMWLAVRVALFGLVAGYLFLLGFYLYGKVMHRTVYYTKLMESSALSSLPVAILFLACYLIMLKISASGTSLYILCIIISVCYKFYSLYRSTGYNWIEISILGAVLIVVFFMIYQSYFVYAMKDLNEVYKPLNH